MWMSWEMKCGENSRTEGRWWCCLGFAILVYMTDPSSRTGEKKEEEEEEGRGTNGKKRIHGWEGMSYLLYLFS